MSTPQEPIKTGGFGVVENNLTQAIKSGKHVPMQFTLNGQSIIFQLNPQDIQQDDQPIEVEIPTIAGFFTFRWLQAPTQWTIGCYSGMQGVGPATGTGSGNTNQRAAGMNPTGVNQLINQLKGQMNILWDFPYLGLTVLVKVKSIQRRYNGGDPFGMRYTMQLRENLPLIITRDNPTTQFRNGTSPISVTQNQVTPTPSGNIALISTDPHWTSMSDAAKAVKSKKASSLEFVELADSMDALNPRTTFSISGLALPVDSHGKPLLSLKFNPGTVGQQTT